MKKILLLSVLAFYGAALFAQDPKWNFKGMFGASYNETMVSSKWSGAEKNSRSWQFKLDASAERDSEKTNWMNILKEEFGKSKVGNDSETESADLIDFSSVLFRKLSVCVNPYISFILDTQNQEFLYPVTYSESAGLGWDIIKTKEQNLKTRSGVAFRQIYDKRHNKIDPATNLVVQYSAADNIKTSQIETSKSETGAEWITNYDLLMTATSKFVSEARVFTAFKGGVNLRWDNSVYFQLAKYLTLQLGHLTIYNYDKIPRPFWPDDIETRFTVTLGLSYNLF